MDDRLISLFIDDELEFAEKTKFVRSVRDDQTFAQETLDMLSFEENLRTIPEACKERLPGRFPAQQVGQKKFRLFPDLFSGWLGSAAGFAAALLVAALIYPLLQLTGQQARPVVENHRFVLYHPESSEARLVGTFTGWKPVEMARVGNNGYWTITLPLPPGEHRYSFLLEDSIPIPDPTISSRETDDFGGQNSVITVGRNNDPLS